MLIAWPCLRFQPCMRDDSDDDDIMRLCMILISSAGACMYGIMTREGWIVAYCMYEYLRCRRAVVMFDKDGGGAERIQAADSKM